MGSVSQHNTHGPINWFSQSLPLVTGGGSTDGVSSPSLIFSKCIRNYRFVNTFLKFHFYHPMNYLRCSLFNYYTTLSKNFNHKKQKTATFFSDGWHCSKSLNSSLYNITVNTFTICKCIPTLNMCILNSHYINIYKQTYKNINSFLNYLIIFYQPFY